ncbi:hypothetical protein CPJCM30710_05140 [Clostridium polyendosporum]|uniref:DhaL domain-containing protein n=1 Tax=Clostridium polyendosporum TaxID=69208 RepID=A0A919RZJ4_9CLOT|nr:DAK2 domain-containing protein [Clostridium polyendosporum]GIM27848.1 hypothetical protein CPJCM30710_05140 [Clostridium polyendosporum]
MQHTKLSGETFYNMMVNGSNKLKEKSSFVNSLNVFPVPDGDTGTNMSMTLRAAVKEIENSKHLSIGEISRKFAKGALMGARGNSGVILSQILRGISKGLENKVEADSQEFANALREGCKSAYKAVMRPTEGTILTIIKTAAETAVNCCTDDITELMDSVYKQSKIMLDRTPEMLPPLKKAGVVDSGGMGLIIIFEGIMEVLRDNIEVLTTDKSIANTVSVINNYNTQDIKFGYCTEFIILGDSKKVTQFKNDLELHGDSIIVVGYDDVIKVHIHTNDPGIVLSKAIQLGELSKIKIDNMREEHRSLLSESVHEFAIEEKTAAVEDSYQELKRYAFIAVAMGEGIKNIFKDLGVDYVIEGGQTMNPSTQDILDCINRLNAEHIFVLPNNKNIIMSANQAADVSDKDIRVIPTKTIPQGITCITTFNPEADVEENVEELTSATDMVKTGSITYAVRDTEMDGVVIKEGNILGLIEGEIKEVGEDVFDVLEKVLDEMIDDESELITLFYGQDCKEEEVDVFFTNIEEKYSDIDVQCYKGEQPLYYFIISVE